MPGRLLLRMDSAFLNLLRGDLGGTTNLVLAQDFLKDPSSRMAQDIGNEVIM